MSSAAKRLRVLVTGGNRGLGLGIATAYAERGDEVLAVCRQKTPQLAGLDVEVVDGIELTDDDLVASLRDRVGRAGLDVLICNAGINRDLPGLDGIDLANLAEVFDVNTLGCVRVVLAILPNMNPGSKIMLVGSMGLLPVGILRNRPLSNYGYRMSKTALVAFGHALAHDVRDRGIAVAMVSPGAVDTDMFRTVSAKSGTPSTALQNARDIVEAGRMLRDRMDHLTLGRSPAFDRDPDGNPAIPPDLLQRLREAKKEPPMGGSEVGKITPKSVVN